MTRGAINLKQTFKLLGNDSSSVDTYIWTYHTSAAKKGMQHTSVLFTGTARLLFSTPHNSITTGPYRISRIIGEHYIWRFAQKMLFGGF